MEKLCVFCHHMEFDDGGYGEYADPASMTCKKGHWVGKNRSSYTNGAIEMYSGDDLGKFREVILLAAKCPDYDGPK